MKPFLILVFIALFTSFNMNAQSQVEVINPINVVEVFNVELNKEITAKKKDILNAKINSKLKGEVDLFFVADKSKMC